MSALWLFFASLTVFGTILYNFSVKMAGEIINPFVFTVILTMVALTGHLAAYGINKQFFSPDLKFSFTTTGFILAATAGLGVVIIDLAYFYAVRSGGLAITNAFWVIGGLIVTALISYMFFNEAIGGVKALGFALGVVSLILITRS